VNKELKKMESAIAISEVLIKQVKSKLLLHRGSEWIGLYFKFDNQLNNEIKRISGSTWSNTHQCWLVPDTEANRLLFGLADEKEIAIEKPSKEKIIPLPNVTEKSANSKYELSTW